MCPNHHSVFPFIHPVTSTPNTVTPDFTWNPQVPHLHCHDLLFSFSFDPVLSFQQSFTSNWPKVLWLAIDENGVHLLEHRSRNVLCTYEYDYILNYSASITALMIITGSTRKQSKIILNTTQVRQEITGYGFV